MTYNSFTYQSEGTIGHRGVFVYYEIYVDVVFLTNLVMDYVLLRLVGRILDCRTSPLRSAGGAAIGALMACLFLYLPADGFGPFTFLLELLTAGIMVKTGCSVTSGRMLAEAAAALCLAAFLCGGFWEALWDRGVWTLKTFFILSGCSYLLFTCISVGYHYVQMKWKNIYPVRLGFQGRVVSLNGYYDTGNRLTDAATGRPVSIVDKEVIKELLSERSWECLRHFQEESGEFENTVLSELKPHFLTCSTVGGNAVLLAVTLEDLCIHTTREVVHIPAPILAISLNPSALGTEYQMIINERLLS